MLNTIEPGNNISILNLPLMLSLVMLPLIDGGFDHPVIYWSLFLLLTASLLCLLREKWIPVLDFSHPSTWYYLFVFWGGVSIIWTLNPHRTLVEFLQLFCFGLIFSLASGLNVDSLFRVGRITWLAGIGAAFFGICQYLFLTTGRIAGTFTNANPFGIYLVMIFLVGWGYCLRQPDRWGYAGSMILLIALFLSGSRGSFIAFVIALLLLFWGSSRVELRERLFKTLLIIVTSLILTQGVMLLAPVIQESLGRQHSLAAFLTRPESFISSSGVGRLAFWEVAGRLALNEPLKGYGLGTFHLAYHQGYPGDIWYSRFTHNHYLQVLAELGIVGFGLLTAFLFTTVKRSWQLLRRQSYPNYISGMIAAMAAFLIHIGVDFSWNFPGATVVFFAIAGGMAGIPLFQNIPAKGGLRLPRKAVPLFLISILLLTIWQYSAQLIYQHGVKLELNGNPAKASEFYSRVISLYPINSFYYFNAGRNYFNLSVYEADPQYREKSLEMLQQAVRFSPADSSMHHRLGKLYAEKGNNEAAEYHLSLAVDYAVYRIGMYIDLGLFYLQQKRMKDAEMVLLSAVELEEAVMGRSWRREPYLKEDLLKLYLLIAELYQETGRNEQATYFSDKVRAMLEEKETSIYNKP